LVERRADVRGVPLADEGAAPPTEETQPPSNVAQEMGKTEAGGDGRCRCSGRLAIFVATLVATIL
jgi:hypothetical protein